jgi:DNA-binding transcriptional MerR regulator
MTALPSHQLLSIGDVLNLLKVDFSDLTISKLRYLETEGLVEPQRTTSGYRKYSHADVQRLRFVLTQQRDQYLPLRVIKEQLDALDRGLEPAADASGRARAPRNLVSVDSLPQAGDFRRKAVMRMSVDELLEAANASVEQLNDCQQFGLISNDAEFFDADDIAILKSVAALSVYGIEARHLRQFKMAADRELGLVAQVMAPLSAQKDPELAQQADDAARDIASLSVGLHVALVRAGITDMTGR